MESFPADRIQEKLALFDWLLIRNDKRISKNAPGWLATAIRKDFPLPRDYLRATRRAKPPAVWDAKSRSESQTSSESLADNPVNDAAQQAIDKYLASLTDEELLGLEATALEGADALLAAGYHRSKSAGGQAHAAYRRMLLEREVKRIVDSSSATTLNEAT